MLFTPTPSFEKQRNEEAIIGMEFWAWKMPSSRKKGAAKASPWGPCEQRSPAAHVAEARGQRNCHLLLCEQWSSVTTSRYLSMLPSVKSG